LQKLLLAHGMHSPLLPQISHSRIVPPGMIAKGKTLLLYAVLLLLRPYSA
jgi:hypothetical protein